MVDLLDRFLDVAARHGDRVAVRTRTGDTSFAELATLAGKFATRFSAIPSPKVLVAYDQGLDAYAAMLGTMLAGGFYAPINVSAPREKVAAICKSFQPALIVGDESVLSELSEVAPQAVRIGLPEIHAADAFQRKAARHSIAYVMFTSGSTGEPKGVVISHAALAHYLDWVIDSGLFQATDRVSQNTNIAFDVSVLDIFGALCAGAMIVPFVSRGDRLMPAEGIHEHAITVWVSTPTAVSVMMRLKQLTSKNLASVRRFFFVGEPLLETHVNAIFSACPAAEIWNAYGPTEATVTVTCLKMTAGSYASAVTTSVAFGTAIPGMELHVLGGDSAEEGELVIVGPQLAEGYWNDPEQTARAFRTVDFSGTPKRAYFSGDWVRVSKGHVYFQSRIDQQVKIDGFRLELGEVAAAIRSLGWNEVVVMKLNGQLTAIIENKAHIDAALIEKELHGRLQLKLEHYAMPSRFVSVEEFPRNLNDKIDLKALAKLAESQSRAST
jgi:D-alanine--poly(phosphoribitol) ligase subunit 1